MRSYLLTGVTGFLGKVLLAELLRRRDELRLDKVWVLIRPKARAADERFRDEVASSDCFQLLPPNWPRWVDVVSGTLAEPGLGLDPSDRDEITGRATHVLHAAAAVEFDLPLARAADQNVTTSLNLLELTRSCPQLEKLVCVSTAYVTPHPGNDTPIEETLAPLPQPAEEIYRSILDGSANERALLADSRHPNTYTLTKSLAEHLLVARRGTVPLAVVRPSIISASWQHPFPGWIDSTSGFAAFTILLGLGYMRSVIADPSARLDVIPVDEVATRILLACDDRSGTNDAPAIHHAVAGLERSATVRECWERIRDFFTVHRLDRRPTLRYLGPPGIRFALTDTLHHRLAIAMARLRSERARRSGNQLADRITYLNRVFPYFTRRSFDFRSRKPLADQFDPRDYMTTVSRGVYRHLMGGDDTQWVLAGRRHPGHGGDLRWVISRPRGRPMVRLAAWAVGKVLRRCFRQVSVDIPSFEAAVRDAPSSAALVVVPSHRSYFDFVLCSYLFFARPDLKIPIPYIAATSEFGRIPLLGRVLRSLHAFYINRGEGREDPRVTRTVHELLREGKSLEFFIEGTRSRSRAFLPPKRGLLRCLQSSGKTCVVLPVAFSFDRIPEERAFARELAGAPKPKMRLRPLLRWTLRCLRGQVDLGRVHIACGKPVSLNDQCDVHQVSQEILEQIKRATVATTFHLRAFLQRHPVEGADVAWLRAAIERRGGRVLESDLDVPEDLDPLIAATLANQFAHLFDADSPHDEHLGRVIDELLAQTRRDREPEPVI